VLQYLGANDEVKAAAGYLRVMPTNVRYEIAATRLINVECSYGYTASPNFSPLGRRGMNFVGMGSCEIFSGVLWWS
jgi:hypothetical protein